MNPTIDPATGLPVVAPASTPFSWGSFVSSVTTTANALGGTYFGLTAQKAAVTTAAGQAAITAGLSAPVVGSPADIAAQAAASSRKSLAMYIGIGVFVVAAAIVIYFAKRK